MSIYAKHLFFEVYCRCTKHFPSFSANINLFYLCLLYEAAVLKFIHSARNVPCFYRVIETCIFRTFHQSSPAFSKGYVSTLKEISFHKTITVGGEISINITYCKLLYRYRYLRTDLFVVKSRFMIVLNEP